MRKDIIWFDKKGTIIAAIIVLLIVGGIPLSLLSYTEYKKYTLIKNWQEDVELFKCGIKHDIPLAIYGLGYAYHTGEGVPKDHKKAREFYKQAADKGEALAQYSLGFMYERGEGGDEDIKKAIYYYNQATDQDYYFALRELARIYMQGIGVQKDVEKAKRLEQRSLKSFGKSLSYRNQYKQIIKYQLGEFDINSSGDMIDSLMQAIYSRVKNLVSFYGY
jgi:TPR repeat protein